MKLPLLGGTYKSDSVAIDDERTINWYPEINPNTDEINLLPTPGLTLLTTVGTGPIRGMLSAIKPVSGREILWVVSNDTIWKVQASSSSSVTTSTSAGVFSSSQGVIVSTEGDFEFAMFADGTGLPRTLYYGGSGGDDTSTPMATFIEGCKFIVSFDARGIAASKNQIGAAGSTPGRFYVSDKGNYTISGWQSNYFATAERGPDKLESIIVNQREIWLLGEFTTEIWWNSGNPTFLFEPIQSGFIEYGIDAAYSAAKIENSVIWLAKTKYGNKIVVASQGFSPIRISTHAIESTISGYATTSDAFAYTYQYNGHFFYILTFPTADATFVYDFSTKRWHERSSWGLGRHRSSCYVFYKGRHLVGDYQNGNIYILDHNAYKEQTNPILRTRESYYFSKNRKNLAFHKTEIEIEPGVGNSDVAEPYIYVDWSDDLGTTYVGKSVPVFQITCGLSATFATVVTQASHSFTLSDVIRITGTIVPTGAQDLNNEFTVTQVDSATQFRISISATSTATFTWSAGMVGLSRYFSSMGTSTNKTQRVIRWRNGISRKRKIRIRSCEKAKPVLVNGYLDIDEGQS